MRRNIGCHTNSNTGRTIYQQVWKAGWQNVWFLQTVVIVGTEIYCFFFNIRYHFHGSFAHSRFCITISSRRVSVNRTEVSVSVHKHIAHRKVLCQTYQCIINRSITMRMISAQYRTNCISTFTVSPVRIQIIFKHGI